MAQMWLWPSLGCYIVVCSGKCQIMHWRRGHRDECCRQLGALEYQDKSDFGGKAGLEKQSEIFDTKGLHTAFASSGSSPSACFSLSHAGSKSSVDICSNQGIRFGTIDRSEKPLSDDDAPDMPCGTASFNEMELTTSLPTQSPNSVSFIDGISCASKSTKTKSGHIDEGVEKSHFSKPKPLMTNDVKLKSPRNCQPTRGSALPGKSVADASNFRCLPSPNCSVSDSVADDGEDDSELFKCKEVRSLSFKASSDHPSSATTGHAFSHPKSAKTDGCHTLPAKVGSSQSLPQDIRNGLKTSVRKVVQQFRASKESKHKLSGLGNDIAGRHNCKIVFPYELFVQLYCYDKVELCPFGLTNCGNSCYANAVLQCLAFTRPLTSYLLHGLHSKSCRRKGWCFICEFECLIQKAKEGYSPLSPIGILSKIHKIGSNLGHGKEEDAHEFLRYAVDTMQSVCLKEAGSMGPVAEETTLVGLTFGGYLRSKIKCMKCLGKSERCEQMMDLTVEIDGDIGTLEEALAQFTATEILDRDNKYYCSRCKSYEKARKKLTILEVPNILTIVLKRFRSGNFEKLNKSIQFPEVLDMAPYMNEVCDKSSLYNLYAVVVHLDIMNAAFSGHYVCYVKNFNGEWFRIDDSTVEPVELERVLLQGAYMLLYARHSPRAPAFIRNNMVSPGGRLKKRNLEAVPSSLTTSKTESNTMTAQHKLGKHYNQLFHSEDWRFHSMQRIPSVDSSSESSSLFSSSDASSCSTASIKDSSSTGDLSDYIFGEVGPNWYSHYGLPSDPVSSSSNGNLDGDSEMDNDIWRVGSGGNGWREHLDGNGNSGILYTDTSRQCRKSCSSGCRDTELEQYGFGNPFVVNSGVTLRRVSGDRSAQTFS